MVKIMNMENVTPEKKQPVIKGLAVAGLFAIIILSAWLAIQIVKVLPTAIDSLASIANSVYNHNPLQAKNIEVAADKTMLQTNEAITLSWPEQKNPGIYTFSYTCHNDISLSLSTNDKNIPLLTCDKDYELGSTTAVSLSAKSDASSIVDVNYKISFFRTNDPIPSATHNGILTISNPNLDSTVAENPAPTDPKTTEEVVATKPETATTTISQVEAPTTTEPEPVAKPTVVATTTVAKTPTKVTVPKPTPVVTTPTYIYKIPVSDPNGTIDLAVTYLGVGVKNRTGVFTKTNQAYLNTTGAFQFSVHNIGTKTSLPWTFTTNLPGDEIFNSSEQTPLKPNERAIITVEFPGLAKTGIENISASITTKTDKNTINNGFRTTVKVVK
jgi:hypothetical protein